MLTSITDFPFRKESPLSFKDGFRDFDINYSFLSCKVRQSMPGGLGDLDGCLSFPVCPGFRNPDFSGLQYSLEKQDPSNLTSPVLDACPPGPVQLSDERALDM